MHAKEARAGKTRLGNPKKKLAPKSKENIAEIKRKMTEAMFGGIYGILKELEYCEAVRAGELELLELGVSLMKSNAKMTRDVSERFVRQVRPLLLLGEVKMNNQLLRAISGGLCPITLVEERITPDVSKRVNAHLALIDKSIATR